MSAYESRRSKSGRKKKGGQKNVPSKKRRVK